MLNGLRATVATLLQKIRIPRPGLWLLPACTFVGLYLYRPFRLGFYSDDWSSTLESTFQGAPFSLERLVFSGRTFERPLYVVGSYLTTSVFGTSAIAWHFALIAVVAVGCVLLRKFLVALGARPVAATLASTLWLVFPWSLGYRVWPICLFIMLSLVCFLAGSLSLLRQRIWPAMVWYLASMLFYEAFYFQFFFVLVLLVIMKPETKRWALRRAGPILLIAQVAVLILNRVAAMYGPIHAKTFDLQFLAEFARMLPRAPLTMSQSIAGGETLALVCLEVAVILVAFCVFRLKDRRLWMRLSAVALGFVVTCLVLSLAGYSLTPLGTLSRSFVAADVWIAAFVALSCRVPEGLKARWVLRAAAVFVFLILAVSTLVRVSSWQRVWEGEQTVLKAIPIEAVEATGPDCVIIAHGLPMVEEWPVFTSDWAMSAAAHRWTPAGETVYRTFLPVRPKAAVSWDGEWIIKYGEKIEKTDEVWVWEYSTGILEPVTSPGKIF